MMIDGIPVTGPSYVFPKRTLLAWDFKELTYYLTVFNRLLGSSERTTRVFCFQATISGWRLYVADIKVVSIQICLLIFDA